MNEKLREAFKGLDNNYKNRKEKLQDIPKYRNI